MNENYWFTDLLLALLLLPEQASTFAKQVDFLHFVIIGVTIVFAILYAGVLGFFLVRYRRRKPGETTPAVKKNIFVELAFWGVPLTVFLGWFAIGFYDYVRMRTPPPDALVVYVTAKQWMWKFTYPEGPSSVGVLHVPAGRPVRVLLTSRDVIHSFFVPAFRIKMDAVPGRYTDVWFQATKTGTFPLRCAEYCGLQHSNMAARVVVLSEADYTRWWEEQRKGFVSLLDARPAVREQPPGADMTEQGRRVAAEKGCINCHTVDGTPHIGPTWRDLYLRRETLTSGDTVIADEGYLTESMMEPLVKVVAGFNPVMPSFRGKLTMAEAAALVEYIKSLRQLRVGREETQGPAFEPVRR